MTEQNKLSEFLARNRIDHALWEQSGLDWGVLRDIAEDHNAQRDGLRETAELLARVIQRFSGVHSVRWRIKDTDHLIKKIIRKCAEGNEKYASISPNNYFETITDLVGIRALHLFKDECLSIDKHIRSKWDLIETPVAYVREGDPVDLTTKFSTCGFEVKKHPAGYRSVHYVCATQPMQRKVFTEIQVRTIFEEGWSEIDHRVRYPDFSDDENVAYFLTIFNRLAGSADEMGTFVQSLTRVVREYESRLSDANREKEDALSEMDRVLAELEVMKQQDASAQAKISTLHKEVAKLRQIEAVKVGVQSTATNIVAFIAALSGKNGMLERTIETVGVTATTTGTGTERIGSAVIATENIRSQLESPLIFSSETTTLSEDKS